MNDSAPNPPGGKNAWLRANYLSLLGIIFAVGIVVAIISVYFSNPDLLDDLEAYGYLGAFVISVILNGTVLFPIGNMTIMVSLGAALPSPLFVGLAGGVGAAIGEMTGYLLGRSGRELIARNRMYKRLEGWVKRWGWLAVFLLSVFPFVFDVVGLIAGALRMPIWRFFLAAWAGRTVSYVSVAYLGSIWLREIPWWGYLGAILVLIAVGLYVGYRANKASTEDD